MGTVDQLGVGLDDYIYKKFQTKYNLRKVEEMRLKAESVLIVILLFGMSTTAFDIQPVKAESATLGVPDDYLTIQQAIDAADSGDTIIVSEGFYSEGQIEVYKPLTLIAEGEVIVDGEWVDAPWEAGEAVFLVTSDNVTIRGFTVANSWNVGILLYDIENDRLVNNCRIEQNKIKYHWFGIFVIGFENVVRENSFSHNMLFDVLLGGWRADQSGFNLVDENTMSSTIGIIVHGNSNHNTIKKNSVLKQAGIILHDGTHSNTILRNVVTVVGTGIEIAGSNNNSIKTNVISSKNGVGIHLHTSSERNAIIGNTISGSSQAGIRLVEVSLNIVKKNIIRENQDGIYLESSDHNALETNIVIRNARYGIAVTTESDHNTIYKNKVLRNSEFDLYWDELGQGNIWERNVYKTKNW